MTKILYVEKMGNDFYEENGSDLSNFRLRIAFIDKDGIGVLGDVSRGCDYEFYTTKSGETKSKLISENTLSTDFAYYREDGGCFRYNVEKFCNGKKPYTQKGLLEFVNEVSKDYYDTVEFVDDYQQWKELTKNEINVYEAPYNMYLEARKCIKSGLDEERANELVKYICKGKSLLKARSEQTRGPQFEKIRKIKIHGLITEAARKYYDDNKNTAYTWNEYFTKETLLCAFRQIVKQERSLYY